MDIHVVNSIQVFVYLFKFTFCREKEPKKKQLTTQQLFTHEITHGMPPQMFAENDSSFVNVFFGGLISIFVGWFSQKNLLIVRRE